MASVADSRKADSMRDLNGLPVRYSLRKGLAVDGGDGERLVAQMHHLQVLVRL